MKSIYYCYLNDLLAFKYMFGEELLYILGHEEEIKNINIWSNLDILNSDHNYFNA